MAGQGKACIVTNPDVVGKLLILGTFQSAVGSSPPVPKFNTQNGTGFSITCQRTTQTLQQIIATVTCSLDASRVVLISRNISMALGKYPIWVIQYRALFICKYFIVSVDARVGDVL